MRSTLVVILMLCLLPHAALAETILLPRLKPKQLPPPAETVLAPAKALQFPASVGAWPKAMVSRARQACAQRMRGLEIKYETMAPIGQNGGCGTAAPLIVTSVAGVAINPPAEANCEFAEALHHWVAWSVRPAAAKHLKKKLVVINNASAYVCRRRNNSARGKLSEHAIANALDISTLGFEDGSSISIKGDWSGLKQLVGRSGKASFLSTIRNFACIRFTTVLGPGSDPYHKDHFHVDLAKRKSGYRICK